MMRAVVLVAVLTSLSIFNVNFADCLMHDSLGTILGTFAAVKQYCPR